MQHPSREPAGAASAVFKVPVETWRSIFHFCLGPSCSDPSQDDLLAYRRLFTDWFRVALSHKERERLRGRISRVCRCWRDIVADMGDGLVVSGPKPDWTWPPGRERKQAKRIVQISTREWSLYRQLLQTPSFSHSLAERTETETCEPFAAPVVNLVELRIEPKEDIPSEGTSSTTVKALHWAARKGDVRLQGLWNPMFRDLVALKIQLEYSSQSSNHRRPLFFPSLRALILQFSFSHRCGSEQFGFGRWSTPLLNIFSIGVGYATQPQTNRLQNDILPFLRAHAQTIKELAFGYDVSQIGESCLASMSFPQLVSCHADRLDMILLAIANLEDQAFLNNSSSAVPIPRLRIYQEILYCESDFEPGIDFAAKIERYSHLYRHVHIQGQYTWRYAVKETDWDILYGWNCFFRAVEDGGGVVEDVEGNPTSSLRPMFPSWSRKM